nr:MAG TPA: hypothetical protein [Caudoviricetes sp.]
MCGRWRWVHLYGGLWYHMWVQDAGCGRVNWT